MRDFLRDPIVESVSVHAPLERCWALSIRIELVQKTLRMTPVGGVTSGSIQAGSRVAWHGWKFGLPTTHHTLITKFEPPHAYTIQFDGHETFKEAFFQDTQERGRFASFQHDHRFREEIDGSPLTVLNDAVRFSLPFGLLGGIAANLLLAPHIRALARQRFAMIKQLAEGEGWREWASAHPSSPVTVLASEQSEVLR